MTLALALFVATLAPPQDPAPIVASACVLDRIEEAKGIWTAFFKCPWPKGSELRLEIQRRTTHMSWVPWLESDATGRKVERVSVSIRERVRTVHRDVFLLEKDGEFSVSWKPAVPGVHHLLIDYEPDRQLRRDPRFRKEDHSEHRVMAISAGQVRDILVEDGVKATKFAGDYFRFLLTSIESSTDELDLHRRMGKYVDLARKRGLASSHPGAYSVLENLSAFVNSIPKDPEKPESEERKLVPNMLDVKSACHPVGVVRESMFLAALLMEDALVEGARLAVLPPDRQSASCRAAVESMASEVSEAMGQLKNLEPRDAPLWRRTEFADLVKRGAELLRRMLDKGEVDEPAIKDLQERLKKASHTIGHPRESLKE